MTVLGQHTVDETRQLMRTAEFRMTRANDLVNQMPFTPENVQLVKDWNQFTDVRWRNAHDQVIDSIIGLKFANPLISESLLPAEKQFNLILSALNKQQGLVQPGDLSDLISRLEKASGKTLDESNHPLPPDFDPDLAAYQKADATIKDGEAAAAALRKKLEDESNKAKSAIPWWVWGIGGAVVIGAGYSIVKTGQQVSEKAKRDTAYIHENMTSKFLPGYKG